MAENREELQMKNDKKIEVKKAYEAPKVVRMGSLREVVGKTGTLSEPLTTEKRNN